jgi:hypothetical protein
VTERPPTPVNCGGQKPNGSGLRINKRNFSIARYVGPPQRSSQEIYASILRIGDMQFADLAAPVRFYTRAKGYNIEPLATLLVLKDDD